MYGVSLTVFIVLLTEGEIVIHVWRVHIVVQVRRQLSLQTYGFMGQLTNLNEQFLIIRYRKRHCCTLYRLLRPLRPTFTRTAIRLEFCNKRYTERLIHNTAHIHIRI